MTVSLALLASLPTDLELLEGVAEGALRSIPWAQLPGTLQVETPEGGWDWLLGAKAKLLAQSHGITLSSGATLQLKTGEMGVAYRLLSGPLPWSPKRVERRGRIRAFATLGQGNRVVSVWELEAERVDTVPLELLELLRVEGLSPPIPQEPPSPWEPAIAILVMGGLLYIFWVFESQ